MTGPRKFASAPAVRRKVPLLLGIAGMAGSGKTYSAHRLARGIVSVTGGTVAGLDTETNRMLHYAHTDECSVDARGRCKNPGHFAFTHMPFAPPYSPLHYVDGVRQAVAEGAGCTVIDSASDMHEGIGGMLDEFENVRERLGGTDAQNAPAWKAVKGELGRAVLSLVQLNTVVIFCFRAKDKKDWGKKVTELGTMAIADDSLIYTMTAQALLEPGAEGVPTWDPPLKGEKIQTKRGPFKDLIAGLTGPLSEEHGAIMGRWAMGAPLASGGPPTGQAPQKPPATRQAPAQGQESLDLPAFLAAIAAAPDAEALELVRLANGKAPWSEEQVTQIRAAIRKRKGEF